MISWPALGTRVTLRYRRPPGSVPPLTDAVGRLLTVEPMARVQTKSGAVVEVAPGDVVALRVLTDAPVRTADIRALEHAAAAAWRGTEHTWLDGWLLRAHGPDRAANSAAPLDISARMDTVAAIAAWYTSRGLTPRLVIPDRLLPTPPDPACETVEQVLVRDLDCDPDEPGPPVRPDEGAVRAAISDAPDGTRWVGLSAAPADDAGRCEELLAWGACHGATRAHLAVAETDSTSAAQSLGFRLHHRRRYVLPSVR
ncbi:GNAT family N-acetyltransferase, cg3035/Rv0428c family [Mycobacterium asiaticum]|uniref:GCN5 family acetyltransferase n=1 Tax=Mycobacterium asiaticum TaxID=1790 RepID=A0A1A3C2U2_MYCAS|nr:GCN5 family acetyltransferase [Mycobacterium asiaticum]OBI81419.1 GCN5 family acetyltransferase [Mycobacterium asiaticum]